MNYLHIRPLFPLVLALLGFYFFIPPQNVFGELPQFETFSSGRLVRVARCEVDDAWVKAVQWEVSALYPEHCAGPGIAHMASELVLNTGGSCFHEYLGKYAEPLLAKIKTRMTQRPQGGDALLDFYALLSGLPNEPEFLKALEEFERTGSKWTDLRNLAKTATKSQTLMFGLVKCISTGVIPSLPLSPSWKSAAVKFLDTMDMTKDVVTQVSDFITDGLSGNFVVFGGSVLAGMYQKWNELSAFWQSWDIHQDRFITGRAGDMSALVQEDAVNKCDPEKARLRKETFVEEATNYLTELRQEFVHWEKAYLCAVMWQLEPGHRAVTPPSMGQMTQALEKARTWSASWLDNTGSQLKKYDELQCNVAKVMADFHQKWDTSYEPVIKTWHEEKKKIETEFAALTEQYKNAIKDCRKEEADSLYGKMEALGKDPCGGGLEPARWKEVLQGGPNEEETALFHKLVRFPEECSSETVLRGREVLNTFRGYQETTNLRCWAKAVLGKEDFEKKIDDFEQEVSKAKEFSDKLDDYAAKVDEAFNKTCDIEAAKNEVKAVYLDFLQLETHELCKNKGEFADKVSSWMEQYEKKVQTQENLILNGEEKYITRLTQLVKDANEGMDEAAQLSSHNRQRCSILETARNKAQEAVQLLPESGFVESCVKRITKGSEQLKSQAQQTLSQLHAMLGDGNYHQELITQANQLKDRCNTKEAKKLLDGVEAGSCAGTRAESPELERAKQDIEAFDQEVLAVIGNVDRTHVALMTAVKSCDVGGITRAFGMLVDHSCLQKIDYPPVKAKIDELALWKNRDLGEAENYLDSVPLHLRNADEAVAMCVMDKAKSELAEAKVGIKYLEKVLPECLSQIPQMSRVAFIETALAEYDLKAQNLHQAGKIEALIGEARARLASCDLDAAKKAVDDAENLDDHVRYCFKELPRHSELSSLKGEIESLRLELETKKEQFATYRTRAADLGKICEFEKAISELERGKLALSGNAACLSKIPGYQETLTELTERQNKFRDGKSQVDRHLTAGEKAFASCDLKVANDAVREGASLFLDFVGCKDKVPELQQLAGLRARIEKKEDALATMLAQAEAQIGEADAALGRCAFTEAEAALTKAQAIKKETDFCHVEYPGFAKLATLEGKLSQAQQGLITTTASGKDLQGLIDRLNGAVSGTYQQATTLISAQDVDPSVVRTIKRQVFSHKSDASGIEGEAQPQECYAAVHSQLAAVRKRIDGIPIPGERGGSRRTPEPVNPAPVPPSDSGSVVRQREPVAPPREPTPPSIMGGDDTGIDIDSITEEAEDDISSAGTEVATDSRGPGVVTPPPPPPSSDPGFGDVFGQASQRVRDDRWRTGRPPPFTPPTPMPPGGTPGGSGHGGDQGSGQATGGSGVPCMEACYQRTRSTLESEAQRQGGQIDGGDQFFRQLEAHCRQQCQTIERMGGGPNVQMPNYPPPY